MTYTELLSQKEWTEKCNHILQRDKYRCRDCGKIGFHNNTFYVTDSLDEVDEILNEKVLIGDKYSDLLRQTLSGCIEGKNNNNGYFIDNDEYKNVLINKKEENAFRTPVVWDSYKNKKPFSVNALDDAFIYRIWLFNPQGYFSYILEHCTMYIVANVEVESFDFKLYRYPKYARIDEKTDVTYPMAVLMFDKELTDKYYLYIDGESINLKYKNCAFFVHLNSCQYLYDGLNVHHKYYVRGKKPWEYYDDALVTLCADCHKKRHTEEQIPVYKSLAEIVVYGFCDVCDKCGGSGYLPQYSYYEYGICFKCGGEGVIVK